MFKVEQMINARGNGAMNQFILRDEEQHIIAFQSYDSMIAVVNYKEKTIVLGRDWSYSTTTNKHRNIFFNDYVNMADLGSKKGVLNALKNGLCNGWTISVDNNLN